MGANHRIARRAFFQVLLEVLQVGPDLLGSRNQRVSVEITTWWSENVKKQFRCEMQC